MTMSIPFPSSPVSRRTHLVLVMLWLLLLITTVSAAIPHGVEAGEISIQIRLTTTITPEAVHVTADAANIGDEAAHDLKAELYVFDDVLTSTPLKTLPFGDHHVFSFDIPIPEDKRGNYSIVADILFHDQNDHPFSALARKTITIGPKPTPRISGKADDLTFERDGTFVIHMENLGNRPVSCIATLHLPRGLAAANNDFTVSLPPGKSQRAEFAVENRNAVMGGTYPVFCILSYEEGGLHNVTIIGATIRIRQPVNRFRRYRMYWLAGLPLLCAAWAWVEFSYHRSRNHRSIAG